METLKRFGLLARKHKYGAVIVCFLLIICVFDQNNVRVRLRHKQEISQLHEEIERYKVLRDKSVKELQSFEEDDANLERIAREKYGMHLPDEEVFIVKD